METTIERDFETYKPLQERLPETVGVIELEFGQYSEDFATASGYRVDVETQKILFSFRDPNDPIPEPEFQKPLTEQLAAVKKENAELQSRLSDVEVTLTEIIFSY